MNNAECIELVRDCFCIAVLEQEAVRDDEGTLFAHDIAELIECDGQAALLDIDLFRRAEPQHILSPLGNGFDIEQMLDTDVFADRIAAP